MSDGINHGQTITYCETCRYPVGVCKCDIDISAIPLALCPLCDARVKLIEGFDIDCESTTAVIECTACPLWFGPHYPDNKHDVVRFIGRWNTRKQGADGGKSEENQIQDSGECGTQSPTAGATPAGV